MYDDVSNLMQVFSTCNGYKFAGVQGTYASPATLCPCYVVVVGSSDLRATNLRI